MKCIGLLGGMSWESTVSYYQALNRGVKARLGGLHSARVLLSSVDFAEIERLQHAGDWPATARLLAEAARNVQAGGADFLLIGTNTMHKVAPEIEAAIDIPLLHIADATAHRLLADGVKKVGLLGTRFTMEQDFYKGRLQTRFGLEVLVPPEPQRERVHRIIYDELCLGQIREPSRAEYLAIIEGLAAAGAEAVILGCTEIALLVGEAKAAVPLYDTTAIHAEAAVTLALG
ncbi:aspartate/glutamate racemase family protein [Aeromonas enteropelogenes]|uniref:aspartate/glutamate racemase family protein n=1 Tax=Aeromonas enteropelogenes TaxID=29489 RepID=UPI001CBF5D23|nr:aspartate/glutamate racemase family protein [Aeromonas enteropelogenes]MCZ0751950.1 aspartate/glutamate racemase family protein [Aeromonas enteropelogenes]UAK71681.1 aspartate/glutamate racemase family protein [Aeromonas enteropelogenes]